MLGYLFADIICSEKRTVFRERGSRKTVSFKEQIMSEDKYQNIIIFEPNGGYWVYYPSNIFLATRTVLKIGKHHSDIPQFQLGNIRSRGALKPIAREQKYLMDYNDW